MYQEIVVPMNGEHPAERVLPTAAELARRCDATLAAFSMVFDNAERAERAEYLEQWLAKVDAPRKDPRVMVGGDPADAVLQQITVPEQLLCLGIDDVPRITEIVIGSITSRIVTDSIHPVFVVGPDCADAALTGFHTLIVALDGTKEAEAAIPLSLEWAKHFGLAVTLVQVLEPQKRALPAGIEPMGSDVMEAAYLESTAHHFRSQDTEVSWEVLHGTHRHVVDALVEYASSQPGAVLVVTPTVKPGHAPVLGRVSRRVLYHSPVPVLLARQEP